VTSTAKSGLPIQYKLGELISMGRVYVTLDDSTLVATATMMDHGISWLPVVHSKERSSPNCSPTEDSFSQMSRRFLTASFLHKNKAEMRRRCDVTETAGRQRGFAGGQFRVNLPKSRGWSD